MAKFIFSKSWEGLVKQFSNWNGTDASSNPIYYSIAFTDDGYLATHGKRFKLTNADGESGEGGTLALSGSQLTFTDALGVGHSVTLPVINVKGVDGNPVSVNMASSEATVQLETITGLADTNSVGSSSATAIQVPSITFDKYGRITAGSNLTSVNIDKVTQTEASSTDKFYLLGRKQSASGTLTDTYYNKEVSYNGSALVAPAFQEGSDLLSDKYVQLANVFTKSASNAWNYLATDTAQGVVFLSDVAGTQTSADHIAATPYAVDQAITTAKTYADGLFAANDAMVFAGTIDANGNLSTKNGKLSISATNIADVSGKAGWTFKFEDAGSINIKGSAVKFEAGDMLVCTSDDKKLADGGWSVIQANIDGAVTAASAFDGTGLVVSTGAGRSVSVVAYPTSGTKVLKATSTGLTWSDDINSHRQIQIGNTVICGTDSLTALKFVQGEGITLSGSENGGSITVTNSSPLSAAVGLTFKANDGGEIGTYNPSDDAASVLKAGSGLQMALSEGAFEVKHSNTVAALTSQKLGKISYDANGHITGFTEVTSLVNPNALTFTQGTNSIAYTGAAAQGISLTGSGDLSISSTLTNNVLAITASVTHKYKTISYKNASSDAVAVSNNTGTGITLNAGNNITFSGEANSGALTIAATDTWRNVLLATTTNQVQASINTSDLKFGTEFVWDNSEVKLAWAEIDENGVVTYAA